MSKIHGKLSSFEFGGNEICFQDASNNEDWEVRDATDSCTIGDGEETSLGRKTEIFELSGYLKDGSGNRISCKNIKFTAGANEFKARNITLDESGVESDSTDGGTAGNGTETEVGYVNRKSQFQYLMHDNAAEPARNSNLTVVVTFAPGVTITGNLRFESLSGKINVKDMIGVDQGGTWQGGVTKAGMGNLNVADSDTVAMIFKTGGSANKELTGSAVITGINFVGDYKDDLKVTYRFKVNGELTPAQYAV